MGKKVEKSMKGDKNPSAVSQDEEDPNKTPEPYNCTGNFQQDFTELCRRNNMASIPNVIHRARVPTFSAPESSKPEKGKDKGKQAVPEPEPEPELDPEGELVDPPPKTYTVKDKFEYFKPSVQVEMENYDKPDTVSEMFVRGWKIDDQMMNTFKQCWSVMEKLHTINLWNVGLTGETVSIMASTLTSIANLRTLILDGNAVKEENWHELIHDDSPVQNLSVRHCCITDKGAAKLGEALGTVKRANTKLISLNLSGNRITDEGVVHLGNGLRMNRTLMSLSLASNQVGDKGASKIGEVLSRFPLSHEEVVERRRQKSTMSSPDRLKTPPPSRRADSKDRPGSVRSSSQHDRVDKTKQKPSAKKKDEKGKGKEELDKSKGGKKEEKAPAKKASIAADTKTAGKGKGKGKEKGKPTQQEPEDMGGSDFVNPLTDEADFIDGQLFVAGNRVLINLNLSRNEIGEPGMAALLKAMQYQTTLLHGSKAGGTGLMRICVLKNKIAPEHDTMKKLNELMLPKDPYAKGGAQTPDGESTT
ncbi:hypothetical protein FSP39_021669 [Pinctada imbricata]|uniref:Leucine-rich repeat-containing protein 71 n=1 Tax=Pinctada imbricata TaxID=66713 RepID=A0AA89C5Y0_PINIB|nr:hypothetical protein FSP39_021669 [Pinctada imbricata]